MVHRCHNYYSVTGLFVWHLAVFDIFESTTQFKVRRSSDFLSPLYFIFYENFHFHSFYLDFTIFAHVCTSITVQACAKDLGKIWYSYPLFIFQQDDNGSYACKRVMPNGQHRVKIEQHRPTNGQHRPTNEQHRPTNGQHRVKIEQHRPTNEQHCEETIIVETDSLGRTTTTSSRNLKEFFSQASFEQAREHLKIMWLEIRDFQTPPPCPL